jgi:uncharacterized protein (TIGR03089 family)
MPRSDGQPPTSIAGVLRQLTADPGRPRLTWYGTDGERVELSGHVLDNWVAKTTNLLVEEFDAGPATTVLLDLPAHWRTVVWACAAWLTGATVLVPDEGVERGSGAPDIVVSTDPAAHPRAASLVAVSLPALSRRFDGVLPPGAIDAATSVMTYPDQLGWVPAADGALPALVSPGLSITHVALLPLALERARSWADRPRLLIELGRPGRSGADTLLDVLASLVTDGSAVLVSSSADVDRIVGIEKATDRV